MKLYDRIWAPSNSATMDGGFKVIEDSFIGSRILGDVEPMRNVIVITTEELREVFNAGRDFVKEQSVTYGLDFNQFMESKGIKI